LLWLLLSYTEELRPVPEVAEDQPSSSSEPEPEPPEESFSSEPEE
jgi:hypothetical protein